MKNSKFDDLRPYYDEEINPAMNRLADNAYFPLLSAFAFPDTNPEKIRSIVRNIRTIDEFQSQIMKTANEQIIARSITSLTSEGIENLDKNRRYLFISNHRDIMLDASLLQYILVTSGYRTSEITFGSNLMNPELVVDIGKSNKMFKVIREGNIKDLYTHSLHLSEYIRYVLLEKRESVWIAQRNGRTKNGIDATDRGIIKMLYLSKPGNPVKALAELNIVPVSVSYQWESCDFLKAEELYLLQKQGKYVKQPGEDLHSILTGIMQAKGAVHISIGTPLTENDLSPLAGLPDNKFNKQAALLIDKQIISGYRLSCNNYIAHDLRSGSNQYTQHYTEEEKKTFFNRYRQWLSSYLVDKQLLGSLFLDIYANPVNKLTSK
ncbi:MAG: 1-acyl-sn-glycerol-3-phosphate acyltransferase [Dysgonamonadaceae bacterium]|jgi:hypothetical protein|nr:1-acyl-sn-glycerol-3-phosphate acyltransferase [Dysgonamonadaceae bacterium]